MCPYNAGIRVTTSGPIYVKFTADGNPPACAPGNAQIILNDWNAKQQVQPGQSMDFYQQLYAEIRVDGVLGGCNKGAESGWSGSLHVETDNDALAHAPQAPHGKPPILQPH
jgi:hypothetical protein